MEVTDLSSRITCSDKTVLYAKKEIFPTDLCVDADSETMCNILELFHDPECGLVSCSRYALDLVTTSTRDPMSVIRKLLDIVDGLWYNKLHKYFYTHESNLFHEKYVEDSIPKYISIFGYCLLSGIIKTTAKPNPNRYRSISGIAIAVTTSDAKVLYLPRSGLDKCQLITDMQEEFGVCADLTAPLNAQDLRYAWLLLDEYVSISQFHNVKPLIALMTWLGYRGEMWIELYRMMCGDWDDDINIDVAIKAVLRYK